MAAALVVLAAVPLGLTARVMWLDGHGGHHRVRIARHHGHWRMRP